MKFTSSGTVFLASQPVASEGSSVSAGTSEKYSYTAMPTRMLRVLTTTPTGCCSKAWYQRNSSVRRTGWTRSPSVFRRLVQLV